MLLRLLLLPRWLIPVTLSSVTLSLLALGACHSSSAGASQCNASPWECQSGQTCWPQSCSCPTGQSCDTTNCTPQFQCLASAAKQLGDTCTLVIGSPTCGDGQTCFDLADAGQGGVCRAYCDPSDPTHGCGNGFQCMTVLVGSASSAVESVCLPVIDEDASFGVDAGSTDDGSTGLDPDALPNQGDAAGESGQMHQ